MQRRHLLISGRVQGVFFRSSTQDIARDAGCTGWVRNRDDGRVEVEVQGDADAVQRVIEHCRVGPPQARVADVAVAERAVASDEHDFEVR
jgi:acylphosphatase